MSQHDDYFRHAAKRLHGNLSQNHREVFLHFLAHAQPYLIDKLGGPEYAGSTDNTKASIRATLKHLLAGSEPPADPLPPALSWRLLLPLLRRVGDAVLGVTLLSTMCGAVWGVGALLRAYIPFGPQCSSLEVFGPFVCTFAAGAIGLVVAVFSLMLIALLGKALAAAGEDARNCLRALLTRERK